MSLASGVTKRSIFGQGPKPPASNPRQSWHPFLDSFNFTRPRISACSRPVSSRLIGAVPSSGRSTMLGPIRRASGRILS